MEALTAVFAFIESIAFFLFTTVPGLCLSGLIIVLWLILTIGLRLRENGGTEAVSFFHMLALSTQETGRILVRIVTALPVLLGMLLLLTLISGLTEALEGITGFVENQQRIQELETTLALLDTRYRVAEVEVLESTVDSSRIEVFFYDEEGESAVSSQIIVLPGRDVYFDSVVLNFDYAAVAEEGERNIALPYRVFCENLPAAQGIPLQIKGQDGLPYIFQRDIEDIYGMDEERFAEQAAQVARYLTHPEEARRNGVRTIYGSAVHRTIEKGDEFSVWIEQTGGLVLRSASDF